MAILLLGLNVDIIKTEGRLRSRQGTDRGSCTKEPWLMTKISSKQVIIFFCEGVSLPTEGDTEWLPLRTITCVTHQTSHCSRT